MDKNELKVMALRERVAQLTADYEDKIADLRVELTLLTQRLEELEKGQEGENVQVPEHPAHRADTDQSL